MNKSALSENARIAARLRAELSEAGALALNFIGSRGAGKTALLERTLERLPQHTRAAVLTAHAEALTGDLPTADDAIRLQRYGYPVKHIATGGGRHLDAEMVEAHLDGWLGRSAQPGGVARDSGSALELLLIENVGDLVSHGGYDLGEDAKIVILSVTEGEDKPLKCPEIFRQAELLILNKIDLLPQVPFKVELARENARRIRPDLEILEVSSLSGAGFDRWLEWLAVRASRKKTEAMMALATHPF